MTQLDNGQLLSQAIEHHRAGRVREAEVICRQIIQQDPNNADAFNLLGAIAGQSGYAQDSVNLISRAISLRPDDPKLYQNLATSLRQVGRYNEAIEAYRKGLAIKEDVPSLIQLANLYWLIGNGNDAEQSLLRALQLDRNSVMALHGIGSIYLQLGFYDRAAEALKRAVTLNPQLLPGFRDLGVALYQLNWFDECIEACRSALALSPTDIVALNHLGMSLQKQKKFEEAKEYLERVANAPAARDDEWFNRGLAMSSLYNIEEAERSYREALKLKPNSIPAKLNLGVMLGLQGKTQEALAAFEQVMKASPGFETGILHHGVSLLLTGQFEQGWKEYQSRWKVPTHHEPQRPFTEPLWRDQSVRGKTILVYREQGFGDTINFCRYVPMIKERGAKVILEIQPELVTLLKRLKGADEVIEYGSTLPPFDLQVPMLDLPLVFKTNLSNIPAKVPYLSADPQKVETWSARLKELEGDRKPAMRVGIAWAGSPTHPHDRGRSMKLADFAPLAQAVGDRVHFISLQKGAGSDQAANPPEGMWFDDPTANLKDFDDTAALMMNLDLLICVDTSVVHLAGAMARPVWVLLPIGPDWRWLEHREDSPWYPTMRLFRQQKLLNWPHVMERVVRELKRKIDQ